MPEQQVRIQYLIQGVVQGVGFRPTVTRLVSQTALTGTIANTSAGVTLELQGSVQETTAFIKRLQQELPPLASISHIDSKQINLVATEQDFRIIASDQAASSTSALLPPDVALCEDCRTEYFDPTNRRYRYPFITCTNCGPRLSITTAIPYDRPNTTMAQFPLCPACVAEYHDPTDRRFHAQPISCWECGPQLNFYRPESGAAQAQLTGLAALTAARQLLAQDGILAVKGIGGFHLMCKATGPAASLLRQRKHRPDKPLAIMVPDLDTAKQLVAVDAQAAQLLTSPAHPIVLLPKLAGAPLADSIAPGLNELGIMLPYAPIHLALVTAPVVATSANVSGEPIITDFATQGHLLAGLVDGVLDHNRAIAQPVEDSVMRPGLPLRRSRGYAPLPVPVPSGNGKTVISFGGELKNTVGLASGELAHLSGHLGDQQSLAARKAADLVLEQLIHLQQATPELVVCDLHPDYGTTKAAQAYAAAHDLPLLQVQHHVAHALSLMAEQNIPAGTPIFALDGTGYGEDGTIWGGELLQVSAEGYTRAWHLPQFPLLGGDKAVQQPWRATAGVNQAFGLNLPLPDEPLAAAVTAQLQLGKGATLTSSCGRLCDAAASVITGITTQSFEAQAVMQMEAQAHQLPAKEQAELARQASLPATITDLLANVGDLQQPAARRAWIFYDQLAHFLVAQIPGQAVGLTGGSAQSVLLKQRFEYWCQQYHISVFSHQLVPPNDGGLALGQLVAGRWWG